MLIGKLAVILCSGIFARVWVTVLGLLQGNSRCPMGQWFTVAIKCACLFVVSCSFTVRSQFRVSCWVLLSFSVFSPPSSPLNYYYYYHYCPYISTEPSVQCDECLHWGWVWQAGLVAGLPVGQAFGAFLPLGLQVGLSSPQVLRHPTSMCDSGVNNTGTMHLNTKKGINTPYHKN